MPRALARFRQADISRAIKGAQAAGLTVTGTRIDATGTIEVICANEKLEQQKDSALDKWLAKKAPKNAHHCKA